MRQTQSNTQYSISNIKPKNMKPTLEQINEKHKVEITGTSLKNMPFGVLKEIVKDLGLKYIAVKREVCETNVATFFGITLDAPALPVEPAEKPQSKKDEPKQETTASNDEEFKNLDHVRSSKDFFMFKRFLVKHDKFKPGMNVSDVKRASIELFAELTGVVPTQKPLNPVVNIDVVIDKKEITKAISKAVKKVVPKAIKITEQSVEAPKEKKEKVIPKQFEKLQLVNGVKYGHQPNGIISEEKLKDLTVTNAEREIFERKDIRDSDKVRELVNIGSKLKIQQISDVLIRSYAMVYEMRKKFILGKNKKDNLKYTGKTFKSESAKEIKEIRLKEK